MQTERRLWQVAEKNADLEKNVEALKAVVGVHEQLRHCEALYLSGHIKDAAESLIGLVNTAYEVIRATKSLADRTTGELRCRRSEENLIFFRQISRTNAYRT